MNLKIFIPVFNEKDNIAETLEQIRRKVKAKHTVVVIDDCSDDGSREILSQIGKARDNIDIIFNDSHKGFGLIFKQALESLSKDDVFVPVMADGCDDPEDIDRMYAETVKGAEIVCASRYIKNGKRIGGSLLKSIGSRVIGGCLGYLKGMPCRDMTNSFKMYRCDKIKDIILESRGFDISFELMVKACELGMKTVQIPTRWQERKKGCSSFRILKHGFRYLRWIKYGLKINNR